MYAEFRAYMSATHGVDWLRQLTDLRTKMRPDLQRLRSGEGPNRHKGGFDRNKNESNRGSARNRKESSESSFASKRSRETFASNQNRTTAHDGKAPPAKRTKKHASTEKTRIGSRSCRPIPTSPATELLQDATAGMSVLSKICNASWWDWSRGSTLVFWRWPEGEQRRASRDGMDPRGTEWTLISNPSRRRSSNA
jgi:hypothetical protein